VFLRCFRSSFREELFVSLQLIASERRGVRLPKKDFSSFDLRAVVSELKDKLVNSRVNNVYQLDGKTLLFKLHKVNEPPMRLVLEAGRRLHLTGYSLEKPQTPPAFCMTLRKYLPGAWITNLEQYEFERIAVIHFQTRTGPMRLVLELFGEGNLILLGEKSDILQALIFKKMRDRNIVRNEPYQYPPSISKNPFKVTVEEFDSGLKAGGEAEVVRAIIRFLGIGGVYGEELLLRANVDKTKHCNSLNSEETEMMFKILQELLSSVSSKKLEPNIVLDNNGGFMDVLPFKLNRYASYNFQSYETFDNALDEFYVRVTAAEKAAAGVDVGQFKREADRLKRMIAEQEEAIRDDERKMARDKQFGDAIYAQFNDLQLLLDMFSRVWREGKDLSNVVSEVMSSKKNCHVPEVFFESFDGKNLAINVKVNELLFSLSLRKNLYENAADFYDRGKRAKQKMALVYVALADSRKKFSEMEKKLGEVEALKTAAPAEAIEELESRKVENKEWFEKFRWFTSSEGFLVVAGKDVVSNEVLVKKYTDPYDIVFHAEIVGAPFAVVKTAGKEPGEQTLKEAGEFAASFSRAWREKMGSVDVYWVKPDQLGKSGPSGESIPHGAFAVIGKRNWMRGTALKLAIGVLDDEEAKFVGGPVDAVKAKTKINLVIVPGDSESKELLKSVLRSLTLKLPKEQREKIAKASIERIRDFIPYTRAQIIVEK
jgi:predicted ribosome quality control (RQC) complex YloA/Tae2 family protein